MSYRVEIVRQAVKEYAGLPAVDKAAVKKGILGLEKAPRGPQVKKLEGREYYRLRVGDWRVIFAVSDARRLVTVIAVERRTSTAY